MNIIQSLAVICLLFLTQNAALSQKMHLNVQGVFMNKSLVVLRFLCKILVILTIAGAATQVLLS
jgi:hypothetical protein